jgi:hypothetical protein
MNCDNWDNYEPVTDTEGRLIDLSAGSFREVDETAEEILRNSEVRGNFHQDFETPKPYFAEDLIEQYNFFRKNIYNPQRVFYPCSNLDVSPLRGFPNSEIVLMDNEQGLKEIMKQEGIEQFVLGDVLNYSPDNPFDLVIALNPSLTSMDLIKNLSDNGYVLANNWHNNASQLLEDSEFEGIGTIDQGENGVYLASRDFSKLEPNQFATYFYVFRKLGVRE